MGADKAIHVLDPGLHGSDAVATSLALAKALGTSVGTTWSCWARSPPMRG